MQKKIIAILEDDAEYLRLLELLFSKDYIVYGAPAGHKFITKISERKPDLFIVDLMLPHHSGETVMSIVSKLDMFTGVPVIIVSAKMEDEIKKAAGEMKAAAYFKKPVENKELLDAVKKVLSN